MDKEVQALWRCATWLNYLMDRNGVVDQLPPHLIAYIRQDMDGLNALMDKRKPAPAAAPPR